VVTSCSRRATKASRAIFSLFCAVRTKRIRLSRPESLSRCWVSVSARLEVSEGLRLLKKLVVRLRRVVKPSARSSPGSRGLRMEKS